ncbi:hypothetical protein BBH99_10385 [Chryseobacterium contaminans]|uniref:DUF6443 domain-containing protein n=1 Tax=Chryseobacterium contaminans TaxID=1423959 RepID=A0ABX2X3K3_9FLAO|nr:hypothetical protein BBH99_10385 [Chryseobacterium contaminans]
MFYAQSLSNTENYTYSRTYLEPVTTEQPGAQQQQTVQYFDGLGRSKQNIGIKASPLGKDIVIPITYDNLGRPSKSYLPLPVDSQNGAYIPSAGENSVNAYYNVSNAFSEVAYENSPLGRIEKSAAPGSEWQLSGSHTPKAEYLSNAVSEVKRFKVAITWNPSLQINDAVLNFAANDAYTTNGYYNANTLYKSVSKDEDGNESHSFTNSLGQTILVRKINVKENGAVENLDTYYVYDDFGNLSFMIPPKAAIASTGAEIQSLLNPLCYQYKYDKYNRLAEKKLPGKGWEYFVYDKQNRQVLGQDANLRTSVNNFGKPGWMFTKYDAFGRIVYSGFFANTASRIAMQTALNNMSANANNNETVSTSPFTQNNINVYYTKEAFPTGSMTILTVNYYDEYPEGAPQRPDQIQNQPVLASASTLITSNGLASVRSTKALPTIIYTKNIENDSWSSDAIWYDQLGRTIGSYSKNHLGGVTRTEALLDFSGKTQLAFTYHSKSTANTEVTVKDRYTYSPQGYLLKHYQQVDSGMEELLSDYTYNDLGQVINKKVGNNLQSIDYTYNIRGWLTGINAGDINNMGSKLFAYKIKYNMVEGAETPNNEYPGLKVKPKFNGSISEIDWKVAGENILKRYGYSYDGTERLRAGFYQNEMNPYLKEYSEIVDYDKNGNISALKRTANSSAGTAIAIDDLTYIYDGNRLSTVTDYSQNYAGYPSLSGIPIDYDSNGNMTSQKDKGILQIKYNHLNLPSSVTYDTTYIIQEKNGTSAERNYNTQYIYSADGTKLKTEYTYYSSKSEMPLKRVSEYLNGFQYEDGGLQFFINEEGYYDYAQKKYIYNYVDHLGNVRVSYARNSSGSAEIIEENHYYPFGLRHNASTLVTKPYRKKYNGKELQENGMLDYGWRQYMPELGRWNGMDQLSESYHSASPYAYVMNNPVNMFDPDGRVSEDWVMSFYHNSQSGYDTSWSNTGSGFASNWGGNMSYEGTPTNFSFGGTSTGIGNGPDGGIFIQIPNIELQGKSSFFWGLQIQSHVNKYMEWWNAKSDFAWDRILNSGRYNDHGINFIGGAGDPVGLFDVAGQILSTWEPENRYLAMGAAIIGAVALRKPGLITAEERVIVGNGGNYVTSMNIIREVQKGEKISDLVSLLQNRTLATGVEHAVVKLGKNSVAPGARVIVSGGPHGISFGAGEVKTIFGHTHPFVTGASAADFKALEILNQSRQYIIEGFNSPFMIRKPK